MDSYFKMDSFNRSGSDYSYPYSMDRVVADTAETKYVSLDNLKHYTELSNARPINADKVKFADGQSLEELREELRSMSKNSGVMSDYLRVRKELLTLC